jgi:hypothetical protein
MRKPFEYTNLREAAVYAVSARNNLSQLGRSSLTPASSVFILQLLPLVYNRTIVMNPKPRTRRTVAGVVCSGHERDERYP